MKNKKILITGITGFIGSNLAHSFSNKNWDIYGTYRKEKRLHRLKGIINKINLIKDDSGTFKTLLEAISSENFDIIIHLAAQTSHTFSLNNPIVDLETNLLSTIKILEIIKKQNKPPYLILASSKGVTGKAKILPVNEKSPNNPEDPYSIHKLALENYGRVYAQKYGLNICVFRLTNVYGPRQQIISPQKGFINFFIGQGIQGKKLKIFGDGKQIRDISYVDDVINAIVFASEQKPDGYNLFYLGTNNSVSIRDIATEISSLTGTSTEFVPYPAEFKSIEVGNFLVDYSKAHKILGWKPETEWKNGLKQTVEFYKKNLNDFLSE